MSNPIVHFEIPADDVERAMKFYKEIFGWEFNKFDMPSDGSTQGSPYYGVMTTQMNEQGRPVRPGEINGGLMKRVNPGQVFTNYISVDSIDEMLEAIEKRGGKVCMPKTEIAPGMGWIAMFQDPENNMMGLHELSVEHKKMAEEV
ncbi:VOC family protein [Candidatus Nomurabacteria bacterium]|nr:VOC family protein [Candidatus Nomurabacteria bacterium]